MAKVVITIEACHAVKALEEAYQKHGHSQTVKIDQGSQFTADAFVRFGNPIRGPDQHG